jgi:hypothetical protein
MEQLLFFVLILACPLVMILMMRSGHRHGMSDQPQAPVESAHTDARIVELEREVARLRAASDATHHPSGSSGATR